MRIAGSVVIEAGGEALWLLAQKAVYWQRERLLAIADIHFGKAAAFRSFGIPVPRGTTSENLDALDALIDATGAQHVLFLGDFLHARAAHAVGTQAAMLAWRRRRQDLVLTLVRGNHDKHAGDPPPAWDVECVADPHAFAPFLACHAPVSPPSGYALCGHVHPGVRLYGRGEETARLPCFVLGPRHAVLPAFGRFTGLALVAPAAGSRLVAIAGSTLFPLPPAGA